MTNIQRTIVALLLSGTAAACARKADLETVPIGTSVEVTRKDGGVVRGTLTERDPATVRVAAGSAARSIPRTQISSVEVVRDAIEPPVAAAAKFREYIVPEGTVLSARLDTAIGSDTSRVEDPVEASLTEAVRVDDIVVLPVGSLLKGFVTTATPSGKTKGRASLGVKFQSVVLPGGGATYHLTASFHRTAASTKGQDAKKIGVPAAGGAVLGAIIGGKKGAGVGAVIGGGAGTAVVLATSGPEIRLGPGDTLALPLNGAVEVQVPIKR